MAPPLPDAQTTRRPAVPRLAWAAATAALVLGIAGWLWGVRALLAEHLADARVGATAQATLDYATLAPTLDEASLQRRYAGLAWHCTGTAEARRCTAALARADGVAASAVTAVFARGQLRSLVLQLPWWRHHAMARALVRKLGAPDTLANAQPPARAAQSLVWQLPGGRVLLPREPGLQPLQWTELHWTAYADMPALR